MVIYQVDSAIYIWITGVWLIEFIFLSFNEWSYQFESKLNE